MAPLPLAPPHAFARNRLRFRRLLHALGDKSMTILRRTEAFAAYVGPTGPGARLEMRIAHPIKENTIS